MLVLLSLLAVAVAAAEHDVEDFLSIAEEAAAADSAPVAYKTAAEVAAFIPTSVVSGLNPLIFIGLGDWGRCGSPTTNPVTRATRCTVQRRMVPSMETWAASLKAGPGLNFIFSVGDNYYDGPMPISGNRESGFSFPPTQGDILAADADPIWDLSFRHVYNTPTLGTSKWYNIQGNHDYGGLLASVVNWGARAAAQGRPSADSRWLAPDLNFTVTVPIGDGTGTNCARLITIDTCPLIAQYRATTGDTTDPDRRATSTLPQVFQDQVNAFAVPGGVSTKEQMRWLRDTLTKATQECKVVMVSGHHGIVGSGQHNRAPRQQDLRVRLSMPAVFQWGGIEQYLNGHDHLLEVSELGSTEYVVTGAGSNIRDNDIPVPESLYRLRDNGFTVHSANTTHHQVTLVQYDGTVVFSKVSPVNPKPATGAPATPPPASVDWMQPGY